MILTIHSETPQKDRIAKVVEILEKDGVVVYPTDTIYGIGCSIYSKKGLDRIKLIKGREQSKRFSILCSDLKHLSTYAKNVSNNAYKLMKKILPGPYTVILEASREIPKIMQSKRKTIGIRVPDNAISREIVNQLGHPIVTTSVNRAGEEPLNNPYIIEDIMGNQVDIVVDGGDVFAAPSTILDLSTDEFEIIRMGDDPHDVAEMI